MYVDNGLDQGIRATDDQTFWKAANTERERLSGERRGRLVKVQPTGDRSALGCTILMRTYTGLGPVPCSWANSWIWFSIKVVLAALACYRYE